MRGPKHLSSLTLEHFQKTNSDFPQQYKQRWRHSITVWCQLFESMELCWGSFLAIVLVVPVAVEIPWTKSWQYCPPTTFVGIASRESFSFCLVRWEQTLNRTHQTHSSQSPPPPDPRAGWSQSSPASRSRLLPHIGREEGDLLRSSLLFNRGSHNSFPFLVLIKAGYGWNLNGKKKEKSPLINFCHLFLNEASMNS